jgi:hypothetical protein
MNAQGMLSKDFLPRFFEHLRPVGKIDKLDVFLFTLGGDTLAAYAFSRFVREFAGIIGVLVPHWCHSAGTLFALGANEIAMTKVGTLSSIDPSITGPLNPMVSPAPGQAIPVPVGVESVSGFLSTAMNDWKLNADGMGVAFRLLAERVNPLLLGDLYRSRTQIIELATRLMEQHRTDKTAIKAIVDTLATKLGSHDYMIGAKEARELLKGEPTQVVPENADLEKLLWDLYVDFAAEMELGGTFNPSVEMQAWVLKNQPLPARKTLRLVTIQSTHRTDIWDREILLPAPPNQPQIINEGWRTIL